MGLSGAAPGSFFNRNLIEPARADPRMDLGRLPARAGDRPGNEQFNGFAASAVRLQRLREDHFSGRSAGTIGYWLHAVRVRLGV